ncbi:exopolyphosphatase [Gilvibacter sp.]|uniref:Ppx/GppA phosphatase family protein n=1 Tax=Gilvibacter sp. TaxID=2729997 RepID=UPI0025C5D25F|nr:exopolyphosphatase [Gilvibacter sp.]NQX78166.1 exopolyphosphatase [Gilvibacter sp.]
MIEIKKYGAIDIGSNAIRLLIATVTQLGDGPTNFKKTSLVRVPIRLGADVFDQGKISAGNIERMVEAMKAFKMLMNVHNIEAYRACATSAMREAANGNEVAQLIKQEAGIHIHIIDGKEEAAIIASTDLKTLIDDERNFLYVDVGGGSTEFTVYGQGEVLASRSFKLGTVRLLNDQVDEALWDSVKRWIKANTLELEDVSLIGSGGNINSIYKESGIKIGRPLTYLFLSNHYKILQKFTYEERIARLGMNADRADVIIPATRIYLSAMKWAKADYIYVPKIGLADGIIKTLHQENMAKNIEVN